eukprot:GSMAST32.ASY1.ANO1.992.1 assembled CDS
MNGSAAFSRNPKTFAKEALKPKRYVPGLGRGALGFTTSADIGPAGYNVHEGTEFLNASFDFGQAPDGYRGGAGRGSENGEREKDFSESNFDKESGFSHSLFSDSPYETEDKEADAIYKAVDQHMEKRQRPRIEDQFADLKKDLKQISNEEWEAIPEIGDRSLKRKQAKITPVSYPVPDNILTMGFQTPIGGFKTPMTQSGAQAREQLLSRKLQKMSDSVSGQTVVDPKGYLTDLNSQKVNSMSEMADIKKGRLLLQSVTKTNPKEPAGWIAYARLELAAGKMVAARNVIRSGCVSCPESEDVWLESAAMENNANAKIILANAVRSLPLSVRIWERASELESKPSAKRRVLRKSLEFLPHSVRLWKAAVALEEPEDARVMLGRAVECVPSAVDLWLALARLESYDNAKRVLNKARLSVPTDVRIWIAASRLEEANSKNDDENSEASIKSICERIISLARKSLEANDVSLSREQWLKEASAAERAGAPYTATAIAKECLEIGIIDGTRYRTWCDEATAAEKAGNIAVARAIYDKVVSVYHSKEKLWFNLVEFEKRYGTKYTLKNLYQKALSSVPKCETFWLMAAKHTWEEFDDIEAAEILLENAMKHIDSEALLLASAKLKQSSGSVEAARSLLSQARNRINSTPRVWMKSALLEWSQSCLDAEEKLLLAALETYHKGLAKFPKSVELWLLATSLEKSVSSLTKTRSLLEVARLKLPQSPAICREANCPKSGILWATEIDMTPKQQQKSRSADALRSCGSSNVEVVLAVARLFWKYKPAKVRKARKWLNRAVLLDKNCGDSWAQYYQFEREQDTKAAAEALALTVKTKCEEANPTKGRIWCKIAKSRLNRGLPCGDLLELVSPMFAGGKLI